jgi:hypothetical protein
MARAFSIRALGWLGLLSACSLPGCGSDSSKDVPIPVPNEFDAYFVAGTVCMPTNVATGTTSPGAPAYPIRFDICRHRCITLDRTTAYLEAPWQCAAGQCNMLLLAHAHAYRVQSEQNCDGRELPSPPPGSCTPETFAFTIDPPCCMSGSNYLTGNVVTAVPFMTLDQAQQVSDRVGKGESVQTVVQQVAGPPPANHQWVVNYDPGNAVVSDAAALGGADCHVISAP